MNYDDARRIGDEAERRVEAALMRLQSLYGFAVHHGLLLDTPTKRNHLTAQIDHAVVDQYGVVIVETKRRKALIRGRYTDSSWTACYARGRTETFQNPLRQNDQQISRLHQALERVGQKLPIDRIRGLVVFVDADISKLELDSVNRGRVVDIAGLDSWFASRADFAIGTPMSAGEQAVLIGTIGGLNRANEPAVEDAHADYRQQFSSGASPAGATTRPGAATPSTRGSAASHRKARTPSVPVAQAPPSLAKILMLGGLALAALALGIWAVRGMLTGTAPIWVWVVVLILLAGLGDEPRRSRRRRSRRASQPQSLAGNLVGAAVGLLLLVGLVTWGPALFDSWVRSTTPGTSEPEATAAPQPVADVALAKQRLLETNPDLYSRLGNPDTPTVSAEGSHVMYEWDALEQSGADSVQVKRVSLTLDTDGQVAGFSW